MLWTGLYGGWGLNRYSPEGKRLGRLTLPVANVTKAAFGGPDLRTLYITSAWNGLTNPQRSQQTLAGGLFRVRVDTAGLPQSTITHGL